MNRSLAGIKLLSTYMPLNRLNQFSGFSECCHCPALVLFVFFTIFLKFSYFVSLLFSCEPFDLNEVTFSSNFPSSDL